MRAGLRLGVRKHFSLIGSNAIPAPASECLSRFPGNNNNNDNNQRSRSEAAPAAPLAERSPPVGSPGRCRDAATGKATRSIEDGQQAAFTLRMIALEDDNFECHSRKGRPLQFAWLAATLVASFALLH
jgi:hypothetical protein